MHAIRPDVRSLLLAALLGAGPLSAGCAVSFDDEDAVYVCASDEDCGGDGYVCVAYAERGGGCCKPQGKEICDGKDNDCDGLADDEASTCPEPGQRCNLAEGRCE